MMKVIAFLLALTTSAFAQSQYQPHQVVGNPLATKAPSKGVDVIAPFVLDATGLRCPTCFAGSAQPLTKVDDTNVTLTLGGAPASALLQAVSATLGWQGQLAASRGGTGSAFVAFTGPTTPRVFTLPDVDGTIALLGAVQTNSGAKTFIDGTLVLAGLTSGGATIKAAAVAAASTWTFPAAVDTVVGKATADVFTNKNLASGTNTFPTFNQNTTGSAASFTGSLAGDVTGTQGATSVNKINGTALSGLATGLLKNTTGTGVPSIAVAGTDYQAPLPFIAFTGPTTSTKTFTLPNANDTLMTLGAIQTNTAAKTYIVNTLILAGSTSGGVTLNASAVAGASVLTLPTAVDTLVGKATADVFTNKTYDTAGTGNSFSINGVAATANSGTGAVVRASGAALIGSSTVNGSTISPGHYSGEPSNGNALAGEIGQQLESSGTLSAAPVSGGAQNITSITLTAGDWDVSFIGIAVTPASTNISQFLAGVSTTSGVMSFTAGDYGVQQFGTTGVVPGTGATVTATNGMPKRFPVSGSTTVYLVVSPTYSVSTLQVNGKISARRAR